MPVMDIVKGSMPLLSRGLSSCNIINFDVQKFVDPSDSSKYRKRLIPTAGFTKIGALGTRNGACRGMYISSTSANGNSRLYGVWGSSVIRFRESMTAYDVIGTITGSNPVIMADNGFDIVFVCDGAMYSAELTAPDGGQTISGMTLPEVNGTTIQPTHVAFIKQRFVVNTGFTNVWMYSDLASTTIQEDSFYSAEASADPIVAIEVCDNSVWIFGTKSYEIWRTQDDQDDPFTPVGGNSGFIGCYAKYSTAVIGNRVFWLGGADLGTSGVFMGSGLDAIRVSNVGIEERISVTPFVNESTAFSYANASDQFYVLDTGSSTYAYNINGEWTERQSLYDILEGHGRWGVKDIANYNGKLYAGLNEASQRDKWICEFDRFSALDVGSTDSVPLPIRRQIISPVIWDSMDEIIIDEILLDMDVGTTENVTDNPVVGLEVSKDGGYTFGAMINRSFGGLGNYKKIVRWFNRGSGRAIVLRFTIDNKYVNPSIFQARVTYQKCIES